MLLKLNKRKLHNTIDNMVNITKINIKTTRGKYENNK